MGDGAIASIIPPTLCGGACEPSHTSHQQTDLPRAGQGLQGPPLTADDARRFSAPCRVQGPASEGRDLPRAPGRLCSRRRSLPAPPIEDVLHSR